MILPHDSLCCPATWVHEQTGWDDIVTHGGPNSNPVYYSTTLLHGGQTAGEHAGGDDPWPFVLRPVCGLEH